MTYITYRVEMDAPPADTPCSCDDCDWRGTFAQLNAIGECCLTPGDPSPAGRCPDCDTIVYVDRS